MALILPNDIANEQLADGDKLQQNFASIEDHTNQELVHRDGSVAMTGALLLPGAPTQPNQAATKAYVDRVGCVLRAVKNTRTDWFGTDERLIPELSGVISPLANRFTTVCFGITIPELIQPTTDSWVSFSLRLGTAINSPVFESLIYDWWPNRQTYGSSSEAAYTAIWGQFMTEVFPAGQQAVLTVQCGGGLTLDIGAGSYMTASDEGPGVTT